jgi:hypothetical protein
LWVVSASDRRCTRLQPITPPRAGRGIAKASNQELPSCTKEGKPTHGVVDGPEHVNKTVIMYVSILSYVLVVEPPKPKVRAQFEPQVHIHTISLKAVERGNIDVYLGFICFAKK